MDKANVKVFKVLVNGNYLGTFYSKHAAKKYAAERKLNGAKNVIVSVAYQTE